MFKILSSGNSEFHLKIKERFLIACEKPELNTNEKSSSLCLFDYCIPARILYLHKVLTFHDEDRYHIETSPITASAMKELI